MKIKDLLSPRAIRLNAPAESKSQAIDALAELHAAAGNLTDPSAYKAAILAREEQGTTAIGEGIAVPHAKSDSVAHAALAAMTVPGGVDYDAPDGKPSSLLFMIAAPPDGDVHLEILSRLMVMLMEPEFCDRLKRENRLPSCRSGPRQPVSDQARGNSLSLPAGNNRHRGKAQRPERRRHG